MTEATPAEAMKAELRRDLVAAMKRGDKAEMALLRQLVAALDKAEAVPVAEERASAIPRPFGSGTTEARRRHLTEEDIQALLRWEIDARAEAVAEFTRLGVEARAVALGAEVELIGRYVRS